MGFRRGRREKKRRRDFRESRPGLNLGFDPLTDFPDLVGAYLGNVGKTVTASPDVDSWASQVGPANNLVSSGTDAHEVLADSDFGGEDSLDWGGPGGNAYRTAAAISTFNGLHDGTGATLCIDCTVGVAAGQQGLVSNGNNWSLTERALGIRWEAPGFRCFIGNGSTNVIDQTDTTTGTGRYLIIVRHATTPGSGSNVYEMRVNGIVTATQASHTNAPATGNPPSPWTISGRAISATNPWLGKIQLILASSSWAPDSVVAAFEASRGF